MITKFSILGYFFPKIVCSTFKHILNKFFQNYAFLCNEFLNSTGFSWIWYKFHLFSSDYWCWFANLKSLNFFKRRSETIISKSSFYCTGKNKCQPRSGAHTMSECTTIPHFGSPLRVVFLYRLDGTVSHFVRRKI